MLMLFVTIVVIHIYSNCALGPAKDSILCCCMQTSSCCPQKFTNWRNPMDLKGKRELMGEANSWGWLSFLTGLFLHWWSQLSKKTRGLGGAGQKGEIGQVRKGYMEESQGQHICVSFVIFYQGHTGVHIQACVTDTSSCIWVYKKSDSRYSISTSVLTFTPILQKCSDSRVSLSLLCSHLKKRRKMKKYKKKKNPSSNCFQVLIDAENELLPTTAPLPNCFVSFPNPPEASLTTSVVEQAVACSLNFAESSMAQPNPHSWTLLPCKSGWPWHSWASGSGPGPYWAWQSTRRQEQAMLSQARACAHALALISLLVEPLNAMPLPEPCCCSSFLPFSEFVHCYFE